MRDYSKWFNYGQKKQEEKQEPVFQQYHYDAKYNVEVGKLMGKLYQLLHKNLPEDVVMNDIKHQEFKWSLGGHHYLRGFSKRYGNVVIRYIMNKDGTWYEAPDKLGNWTTLGYEVNDDTLQSFVVEIEKEYFKELKKK